MKQKYKDILKNKWGIIGAIVGFLILLKDYDFFMNAGGPETLITDWIRSTFNLYALTPGYSNSVVVIFLPFLILIVGGFIVGLIAQKVWRKFK